MAFKTWMMEACIAAATGCFLIRSVNDWFLRGFERSVDEAEALKTMEVIIGFFE